MASHKFDYRPQLTPIMKDFQRSDLYIEYITKRREYSPKRWISITSFLKRSWGSPQEFSRLFLHSSKFGDKLLSWLSSYIKERDLNIDDIKGYILDLELYKSELSSRSGYIVVYSVLIATLIAFFEKLTRHLGSSGDIKLILISSPLIILLLLERSYVVRHVHMCEQLVSALKHCMEKRDLETKRQK